MQTQSIRVAASSSRGPLLGIGMHSFSCTWASRHGVRVLSFRHSEVPSRSLPQAELALRVSAAAAAAAGPRHAALTGGGRRGFQAAAAASRPGGPARPPAGGCHVCCGRHRAVSLGCHILPLRHRQSHGDCRAGRGGGGAGRRGCRRRVPDSERPGGRPPSNDGSESRVKLSTRPRPVVHHRARADSDQGLRAIRSVAGAGNWGKVTGGGAGLNLCHRRLSPPAGAYPDTQPAHSFG